MVGTSTDDFLDRKKILDEQLSLVEKSLNKHNNHQNSCVPKLDELSNLGSRNKIRGFRGRNSMFKRPALPPPTSTNIRKIADHHVNPNKWTHYSLDDVPEMSNESNKAAAFSFLDELKRRKNRESRRRLLKRPTKEHNMEDEGNVLLKDECMDEEDEQKVDLNADKIFAFKKPQKKTNKQEELKSTYRNNKIIMPEYEVGSKKMLKKKQAKKDISLRPNKNNEIKLNHLDDCSNEEESE